MHELSIAQSILDIVLQHLPPEPPPVESVRVRIGRLSGVLADSLEFCFSAVIHGTPLEGSRMDIEHLPARAICRGCGKDFEVQEVTFACPSCAAADIKLISGFELQVAEIVLADAPMTTS
jgi:hydrogenase nickel incorporation protein HypA/HybF